MADQYVHPELQNLAEKLDDDELAQIAATAYEEFEEDRDSRSEWDEMHASWINLFYQNDKPINPPWQGSSEESIPLLSESCTQYSARAFQALFPRHSFVEGRPMGKADPKSLDRAKRVGTHMSWQLSVKDRAYKRNKDRLLLGHALHGSYFTKTYYHPLLQRNVTENVRPADLIVPYGNGPRNIEDLERKTQKIWMSVNKTRIAAEQGYFIKEAEPYQGDDENSQDRAHDEAHGVTPPFRDELRQCLILEQHRFLDLDGDGIAEPYIVWIDAQSREVLRVAIRYDTDEAGNPTENKEAVEYFTHYPYMENPDGFYGLGHGHLIGQINESINKLVRQFTDSATLANVGNHSGFISSQVAGAMSGETKIELGLFKKIEASAEDIARGIWVPSYPGPNQAIREVIELLMMRSDRLASATEALTGQTEKVMQPTALMALVEQGLQLFSAVYERTVDSWTQELEKHYRLNYKHLDPEEYYAVLDADGAMRQYQVARHDYAPDMQVMPVADPRRATTQQRLTKAQAEWQFLAQNPLVINSPVHLYNASYRYLEAIESDNIDEILPYPQGQQRVDDPMMENLLLMQPTPVPPLAFPDQDHDLHMQVHAQEMNENNLSGAARAMMSQHIQSHMRLKNGTTQQGGGQAMAQGPGDGMGPGEAAGAVPGAGLETGILDGAPGDSAAGEVAGPAGADQFYGEAS